jgi:hypothetical protein
MELKIDNNHWVVISYDTRKVIPLAEEFVAKSRFQMQKDVIELFNRKFMSYGLVLSLTNYGILLLRLCYLHNRESEPIPLSPYILNRLNNVLFS